MQNLYDSWKFSKTFLPKGGQPLNLSEGYYVEQLIVLQDNFNLL